MERETHSNLYAAVTADDDTQQLSMRMEKIAENMLRHKQLMKDAVKANNMARYLKSNRKYYRQRIEYLRLQKKFITQHLANLDKARSYLDPREIMKRRARGKETCARLKSEIKTLEYQLEQLEY